MLSSPDHNSLGGVINDCLQDAVIPFWSDVKTAHTSEAQLFLVRLQGRGLQANAWVQDRHQTVRMGCAYGFYCRFKVVHCSFVAEFRRASLQEKALVLRVEG